MKSSVIKGKKKIYPCLKTYINPEGVSFIVLFTNNKTGTCVNSGVPKYLGLYAENWHESEFSEIPAETKVILTN